MFFHQIDQFEAETESLHAGPRKKKLEKDVSTHLSLPLQVKVWYALLSGLRKTNERYSILIITLFLSGLEGPFGSYSSEVKVLKGFNHQIEVVSWYTL